MVGVTQSATFSSLWNGGGGVFFKLVLFVSRSNCELERRSLLSNFKVIAFKLRNIPAFVKFKSEAK